MSKFSGLLLMTEELFFIGEPGEFKPGIFIYPPKVKEVITEKNYGSYVHLLTQSQEDIEDKFMEDNNPQEIYPTPFEVILSNSYNHKEFEVFCKKAFEFFLHQKVTFLYEQKLILVGDIEEALTKAKTLKDFLLINESDFFNFQNCIRQCVGKKTIEPPNPNEHPRIKEMKRKARYRDRVKEKQMAKSKDGITLFTSIVSICCMGVGITPLNIGEMSYVALESILRKYQEKEKYQLDIDSLLAGADSKKVKPKYWIRNFEE